MACIGFQALPVLATLSMAPSDDEEVSVQRALHFGESVVIKNTFIDVCEESSGNCARRSASAPPSVWRVPSEAGENTAQNTCFPKELVAKQSGRKGSKPPSTSWSTASTSQLGDQDELDSLTGESLQSSDESMFGNKESKSAVPLSSAEILDASSADEGASIDNEHVSFVKPLSLVDLVAPPPPPPPRAKLSSTAKAWTPNRPTTSGWLTKASGSSSRHIMAATNLPQEAKDMFGEVVAAGKAAVCAFKQIRKVDVVDCSNGWCVMCSVSPSPFSDAQQVLVAVQTSMASAAARGTVRIIPEGSIPFTSSAEGFGFSVQLAIVKDESKICWDMMKTGLCQRGGACWWQHPKWQTSVIFKFNFSA